MRIVVAQALMWLATMCLGKRHRFWAQAMEGEFVAAAEAGRSLTFAFGCLIAAGRVMPMHAEGRFRLASHALALGVLVPLATLQLGYAVGLPVWSPWSGSAHGLLTSGNWRDPLLINAFGTAAPSLLALWVALALGHLRLAWVVLERDWGSALQVGLLMASVTITLAIITAMLLADNATVLTQGGSLMLELTAVFAFARWHQHVAAPRSGSWSAA